MQLSWPSERFACLRTSEGSARFADLQGWDQVVSPFPCAFPLVVRLISPSTIKNPPDAHRPAEERAAIYTPELIHAVISSRLTSPTTSLT